MLPLKIIRRLHDAIFFKHRGYGHIHYLRSHIRWHWIKTSGVYTGMNQELFLLVEEHHNQLFAWNKKTNKFLGQSSSVTGLFKRIAEDIDDGVQVGLRCLPEDGGLIIKDWAERALIELAESQDSKVLDIHME